MQEEILRQAVAVLMASGMTAEEMVSSLFRENYFLRQQVEAAKRLVQLQSKKR